MNRKPKVVILGAGYGGVVTAIQLQKDLNYNEAEVTLVNKHDYHYFTTHLHMPAAGTDLAENARIKIDKLIDESRINLLKSTVVEIRPQQQEVVLENETLEYDFLVIGLGGEPETFGIPGLREHAMNIRSLNSVRFIREHIDYQFAKYKTEPERKDLLTIVIGGAGFTGIEFVGELADRIPELCRNFDIDPSWVQIYNVEASPNAMPGFDPELVEYALNVLKQKGVIFKLGTAIKECTPEGVLLADGERIKAATVVWTGGIRGNSLVEQAGFEAMRGRVKVDPFLRSPQYENVFIIGDCSIFFNPEGKPYPPTAQIAMQQGWTCSYNIAASIRNEPLKQFLPSIKGTVASLGKGEAIGIVGSYKIKGAIAALMKKVIDIRYLYIIGGIPLVLKKGLLK